MREQRTGVGYESGVTQGIVIWTAAPVTAVAVAQSPVVLASPPVAQAAKGYATAAGTSVAESIVINKVLGFNYKVSNLVSDMTVGALNNVVTDFLRKTVKVAAPISKVTASNKFGEGFIRAQGHAVGFSVGSGFSSSFSHLLKSKDGVIIEFSKKPEAEIHND